MTQTERLYGVPNAIWKDLPYIKALQIKIALSGMVIRELQCVPSADRDGGRINDCLKAIDFNEKLIKE